MEYNVVRGMNIVQRKKNKIKSEGFFIFRGNIVPTIIITIYPSIDLLQFIEVVRPA